MKKAISMLLVVVMVLALVACGSSAAPAAPAAPADNGSSAPAADAAPAAPAAKPDKVYNLIVTNHDASTSIGESYIETLLNKMSEDSNGALTFTYNPGGSLSSAGEAVAAVKNGTVDICWNTTSITVGVFPVSEFVNIPLLGIKNAQMGSAIYKEMFDTIPEVAAEFKDFKVIAAHTCGIAPLSTNKKIESLADLNGMKIRTAGTVQSQYINTIGASAQSFPPPDVYEAMEKNVIDGMTNDFHNIDCFNLYEVIKYSMNFPINVTSCFLLMNKDSYNDLPADLQAIIDGYADKASEMAGVYWDYAQVKCEEEVVKRGGEVYEANADLYAALTTDELKADMVNWYLGYLTDKGFDNAQDIVDRCMAIVDKYVGQEFAMPTELAFDLG